MDTSFAFDVISVGISCLLIVAVGYFLSYFKFLKPKDFQRADRFAGKVCFPILQYRCLAYRKLKEYKFEPLFNAMLMNGSSQILLLIFFIFPKFLINDSLEFYLSTTISAVFVNYVPIGAIVIEQVWGAGLEHIIGICPLSNFLILVPFFLIESKLWEIKKTKEKLFLESQKKEMTSNIVQQQEENIEDQSISSASISNSEVANPRDETDKLNDKLLENTTQQQIVSKQSTNDKKGDDSMRITWRDVLTAFLSAISAPIVVGTLIGFFWSLFGIPYPPFLDIIGTFMGDIVLIFGLLGVGHVLQTNGLIACHWIQLIFLLLVRFFLCPAISWFYAFLFKLKGKVARMSIIFSALPSSNGAYVIAQTAGVGVKATSSMILFTLVLIVPVLILWFYIFDKLGVYMDDDEYF